ncbi:MAG TPA: ABC transporter permease [Rhodopila sp.]|nr:ABC transporter permease [Rhodopila sp.]
MPSRHEAMYRLLGYACGFALLFAVWHIAAVYVVASILFPPPGRVIAKAIELIRDGTLQAQAAVSLRRIMIGFLGGSAIGIPLGLAIGSFRPVRYLLEPFTEFFRFIPATAMITVAVIWFGIGEGSKIFLIIYTTVFIVTLNTAAGVGAISPNKLRAARSLGASTRQVFLHVALPATAPHILTGMRLAMGNAFVTIVAAELIAANAGLGRMIWDARLYMLVDQIFVALLTLGLLGFATDRLFRWAIYTFAGRYSPVA